ncbi:MAG: rhodanese family protein, partial [Hyphomicrobiaceae bacterium]|nr:rhodanese family protein [Hyphomicrobiaceae bacterium]
AGAVLIDIRGADEHARERISGAQNVPLDRLTPINSGSRPVVFHCKAGNRTAMNAAQLAASTTCKAYIVDGGIESWKRAGLPTIADRGQPIEIMRQVQLTAGGLVLLGVVASLLIDPRFIALSGFVGAGLMFAGATGWCGMAKLLAAMPWNRRPSTV